MDQTYANIINEDLATALGCTEPIALAYAAAKARETLGSEPEAVHVYCSGNIIKNVMGVTVPNSGGMKGIAAAALLGVFGGDAQAGLQVLEGVQPAHIALARARMHTCVCDHVRGKDTLYIRVEVRAGKENAAVELQHAHRNITGIWKNGKQLAKAGSQSGASSQTDKSLLRLENIIDFAQAGDIGPVQEILCKQVHTNMLISNEGLQKKYGAGVGAMLMAQAGEDVRLQAIARAAAGSDARMAGCALPVVINSGSGNQGMTVSLPVVTYAKRLGASEEQLLRALALANLVSIHIKAHIGNLSAFCGAVSAACGAACGIAMLQKEKASLYGGIITNVLCNAGGMVCDGAKASCAAKIATALQSAFLSYDMAKQGHVFAAGEGIAGKDAEETIDHVGRMCRMGMERTDEEILAIMLCK